MKGYFYLLIVLFCTNLFFTNGMVLFNPPSAYAPLRILVETGLFVFCIIAAYGLAYRKVFSAFSMGFWNILSKLVIALASVRIVAVFLTGSDPSALSSGIMGLMMMLVVYILFAAPPILYHHKLRAGDGTLPPEKEEQET